MVASLEVYGTVDANGHTEAASMRLEEAPGQDVWVHSSVCITTYEPGEPISLLPLSASAVSSAN